MIWTDGSEVVSFLSVGQALLFCSKLIKTTLDQLTQIASVSSLQIPKIIVTIAFIFPLSGQLNVDAHQIEIGAIGFASTSISYPILNCMAFPFNKMLFLSLKLNG